MRTSLIATPLVITGPWTLRAREQAAAKEARDAFIRYFRKAIKVRNWSPWDDLPLTEMAERGHLLSDDSVTIIEAYLGVEDYVGDYVEDGLRLVHGQRERRNLQLAWGTEELKHAESWELVLLHSGRRTAEQLEEYRDRVSMHTWRMREMHPGLDTSLGVACYAMVQERATYYNYEEMRKRLRREYGLPEQATPFERERGMQIGAVGAFKTVANDEIAHHGMFLQIVLIHLKYLPDFTLETMERVLRGFRMPALRLIPNARNFLHAVVGAGMHTREKHMTAIHNPVLKALGMDGDEAFNRAVQEAKLLPPGLGPDKVTLGRTGEFVIS